MIIKTHKEIKLHIILKKGDRKKKKYEKKISNY